MREKGEAPEAVRVEEEVSACPRCGHGGGFHVAFRKGERRIEVFLICPACGYRFRVGPWTFPSGEPRPQDPAIDSGP